MLGKVYSGQRNIDRLLTQHEQKRVNINLANFFRNAALNVAKVIKFSSHYSIFRSFPVYNFYYSDKSIHSWGSCKWRRYQGDYTTNSVRMFLPDQMKCVVLLLLTDQSKLLVILSSFINRF